MGPGVTDGGATSIVRCGGGGVTCYNEAAG